MLLNKIFNKPNNKGIQKIINQGKYLDNHLKNLKIKRDQKVKNILLTCASDLNDSFNEREDKYLAKYPDAEPIDFINKELRYSKEVLADGEKMRLSEHWFYAINKHIRYLEQCKNIELNNTDDQDDDFAIHSDHSAMYVITKLLQLLQNDMIKVKSFSHLARIIKKHFRCNGSDRINSAESLISKIRRSDRNTKNILMEVRKDLSKNIDFYI